MFPGNVEYVAYERHQDMLREAEQRRLIASVRRQRPDRFKRIVNWIGFQMVKWGTKLQDQTISLPPQPTTAGVTDTKCC